MSELRDDEARLAGRLASVDQIEVPEGDLDRLRRRVQRGRRSRASAASSAVALVLAVGVAVDAGSSDPATDHGVSASDPLPPSDSARPRLGVSRLVSADDAAVPGAKDEPSSAFVQPKLLADTAAAQLAGGLESLPVGYKIRSVSRGMSGGAPITFAVFDGPDGEVVEVAQQSLGSEQAVVMASADDLAAGLHRMPGGEAHTLANSRYSRTYHVTPGGIFTVVTVAYPEARDEMPRLTGAERFADELGADSSLIDLGP